MSALFPPHRGPGLSRGRDDLRQRIRAVNLLALLQAEGYQPQQRGSVWLMCCPFHHEDSPSFTIYRDNHYHCYGCGLHGDVVNFIRQQRGLSFIAACQYLKLTAAEVRR
jgi:DNA primase